MHATCLGHGTSYNIRIRLPSYGLTIKGVMREVWMGTAL